MKRILSLLVTVCFLSLCTGCNGGGGGDSGGAAASDTSIVTLDFDISDVLSKNDIKEENLLARIIDFITMTKSCHAAPLYNYITALRLEITGAGFDPIIRNIPITSPSSTFSVSEPVPNGTNRRFYIELRDINGFVLYSGDLVIDVGAGGAPQDITVDVSIDGGITPEDYIAIGRTQLEAYRLERAYAAFDTALNLETTHPLANFFCGFTHFLCLFQREDDAGLNAAAPNADLAAMFNLYANLDIYTDTIYPPNPPPEGEELRTPYSIAPDIYDDNYDEKIGDFFGEDWDEPSPILTDAGIDAWKNVLLPEIDAIIENLRKAQQDPGVATTLTTDMHSQIASAIEADIKVDRADIYILQAIAYAMKAYINHLLAYNLYTNTTYWKDEMDKESQFPTEPGKTGPYYQGIQSVIDGDPGDEGEEVLDPASGAADYLAAAKQAYLKGLAKFKAALQIITVRSDDDKLNENHIFNVVDVEDPLVDVDPPAEPADISMVDISKVITNIDEGTLALNGQTIITDYDKYDDTSTEFETTEVNLSSFFSSPNRDTIPKFYYHASSDSDVPVFDTNMSPTDPESSEPFITEFKRFVKSVNGNPIDDLQDALVQGILPGNYKLYAPDATTAVKAMGGNLSDWAGINPVIFDDEDDAHPADRDVVKAYLAKGDGGGTTYLYIGMALRGAPFNGTLGASDNFSYQLRFKATSEADGYHDVPLIIELRGVYGPAGNVWSWHLISYGEYQGPITELDNDDFKLGPEMVVFRLPISGIVTAINEYEPDEYFPGGVWDGKEIFVDFGLRSDIASEGKEYWNYTSSSQLVNLGTGE